MVGVDRIRAAGLVVLTKKGERRGKGIDRIKRNLPYRRFARINGSLFPKSGNEPVPTHRLERLSKKGFALF